MLELQNIVKIYPSGGENVKALKGVSLKFRNCEFVSILGPSGCGKTTTLNIIGGLDNYTDGDLIINGVSTKKYNDRDWDNYRNHSIGFVFQSYNLIPHQTVLQNVELALTLSGVSKAERRRRAKEALERVGLANQIRKKPAQMSGGQMQRVAIARAIVNNPDIILADEPTGALDSETSIQVMEILKEIAKDRLVIMVTHNPELAEQYSTRIIRMKDGLVQGDSMPIGDEELERLIEEDRKAAENAVKSRKSKAAMSFATAFGLSLNNLFTKKGRTLLTSFAGSIGIIGIALIYAVSQGTSDYIDKVQEDTLSTYPLSITTETTDLTSIMSGFMSTVSNEDEDENGQRVTEMQLMGSVFSGIGQNDLRSFKTYLEDNYAAVEGDINALQYSYGITPLIYSRDVNGNINKANPSSITSAMTSGMSSSMTSSYYSFGIFNEIIDNRELIEEQYDVLAGRWPENYNELLLVLSSPTKISDILTYSIGLHDPDELSRIIADVMQGKDIELDENPLSWTYDELLNLSFRLVAPSDLYAYNADYGIWEDMSGDSDYLEEIYENSPELKVVGIVSPKSGSTVSALSTGFNYMPELIYHIIDTAAESEIVKMQLSDRATDVFSGKAFGEDSSDDDFDFGNMITINEDALSSAFSIDIDQSQLTQMLSTYLNSVLGSMDIDTAAAETDFMNGLEDLSFETLYGYLDSNADSSGRAWLSMADADSIASNFLSSAQAQSYIGTLESSYGLESGALTQIYRPLLSALISDFVLTSGTGYGIGDDYISDDDAGIDEIVEDILSYDVYITEDLIDDAVYDFINTTVVSTTVQAAAERMMVPVMENQLYSSAMTYMQKIMQDMMGSLKVDEDAIANAFSFNLNEEEMMRLFSAYLNTDESSDADSNLIDLGYADKAVPQSISIYLRDFEAKEDFIDFISDYNAKMTDSGQDDKEIQYTDITGVLMSSVTTIINAITYVLIAFVAISLIVSSIMIGVITLISVQERTKEIGILRAIGASKRNVSSMFNAETMIIGFSSGAIGVIVTYLICIPVNLILHRLTGISTLSAHLPIGVAAILIIISMLLTLTAGVIPSRSAAKKDPVIALRSE